MSDTYLITGGIPLHGNVELSGAKNASVKLMIASILCDGPVVLENIPSNQDNVNLLKLLKALGVNVEVEANRVTLNSKELKSHSVSMLAGSKIRSTFLLFGPLLHRFGMAIIPNPGGCRLGSRPINRIVDGMRALGVEVTYDSKTGFYTARKQRSVAGSYTFEKPTHTGTETLLLLAAIGENEVTLHNCAQEPEIDDLIAFLNEAGARIKRQGADISIHGVSRLVLKAPHHTIEDRNEAITFAAAAYTTGGDITITNISENLISEFLRILAFTGAHVEKAGKNGIRFFSQGRLRATQVTTAPHPGFMTDWQPQLALMMATAEGESVIHETMLEKRFSYVPELRKMGAHIEFFQPEVENPESLYQFAYKKNKKYTQAIRIQGVEKLHSAVLQMEDIRAGAILMLAALSAEGESILHGAHHVERGYENLVGKLQSLGAQIKVT